MGSEKQVKDLLKKKTFSSKEVNLMYQKFVNQDLEPLLKEKVLSHLKKVCEKDLRRRLKLKNNITGALEFKILKENPELRTLQSIWARRRGLGFESLLRDILNEALEKENLPGVFYRNHVSKFEFQPYDLVYFRPDTRPTLIECKASGVKRLKNMSLILSANKRRYENHYLHLDKIVNFVKKGGTRLYFAFLNDPNEVFFVPHDLIVNNLPLLFSKRVILKPTECYRLNMVELKKEDLVGFLSFIAIGP